jgi:uncharacterized membrane protein YcaP (DUF421 family)
MPATLPDLPSDLVGVVLRTVVVYLFLIVVLRLAGKREMGQLSVLELVLVLVIANAVQNSMVGSNVSIWAGLVAVLALIATDRVLRAATGRSPRLMRAMEGEATLLIREGRTFPEAMRREGIDDEELGRALREHGFMDASEVRQAILEVDGTISVIPYGGAESRTAGRVRRRRRPNQQRLL